ncbi:MAG TPA: PAS domain-containing protein, partial [Myxococcaceae bacterium]
MPESPPTAAGSPDSALLFRTFAAAMPQIVWTSVHAAEPDYFNPVWYSFTGLPESLLGAAAWSAVLHPDEIPEAMATWQAAGISQAPVELELRLRRADGAYRWHRVRSVPMKQPEGSGRFWLGIATDIHEQKLVRSRLEESEQRLSLALEGSHLGTWDWDIATDTLRFDPRCKQIFAIPSDAAPGSFYKDFPLAVHPEDRELVTARVNTSLRD